MVVCLVRFCKPSLVPRWHECWAIDSAQTVTAGATHRIPTGDLLTLLS